MAQQTRHGVARDHRQAGHRSDDDSLSASTDHRPTPTNDRGIDHPSADNYSVDHRSVANYPIDHYPCIDNRSDEHLCTHHNHPTGYHAIDDHPADDWARNYCSTDNFGTDYFGTDDGSAADIDDRGPSADRVSAHGRQ